jgi:NAD(P)-dependent dehydrogenase (short-subunit alcohol dehydrogenase family)
MPTDQYEFGDPRSRYPNVSPEPQTQAEPGLQSRMTPVPDLGEDSYRGTGRLAGRKALITGADSGIGAAVAIAYAREGADVALAYLPDEQEDADHVIEQIRAAGRTAVAIPGDLRDRAYAGRLVEEAVAGLGGLDALVSVAGKQRWQPDLLDITDEQFEETFDVNVFALFRLVKAALPHLQPGSTIITTASMEAYQPAPDRLDYAATKGAINNFSKGLSQLLVERGIRVNVVAPGPTWSVLQVTGGVDPESLPEFGSSESPMGRPSSPRRTCSWRRRSRASSRARRSTSTGAWSRPDLPSAAVALLEPCRVHEERRVPEQRDPEEHEGDRVDAVQRVVAGHQQHDQRDDGGRQHADLDHRPRCGPTPSLPSGGWSRPPPARSRPRHPPGSCRSRSRRPPSRRPRRRRPVRARGRRRASRHRRVPARRRSQRSR